MAVPVGIGGLKHRLNGRLGDLTDRRVQLVGSQLAVLVGVGQQEERLHARLDGLAQLGRLDLLVMVGVEQIADRSGRVSGQVLGLAGRDRWAFRPVPVD